MKSYLILFALFVCTMSGYNSMNTKIGWPSVYWEHGFLAIVGYLAVCALFLLGVLMVLVSDKKEFSEAYFLAITFWLGAGFLLQLLPQVDGGIQLIPLPPWYYSGWIAWIISAACWLCIVIGYLCILNLVEHDWETTGLVLIFAIVLNGCLSFCSSSVVAEPKIENVACQDKIAQWEEIKQQHSDLLRKLSNDKEMLETRIKSLGAKTKRELMDHPIARPLVEELEQLTHQIAKVQNKIAAIESVQSELRSLEREKSLNNSGLSEEKLSEVSRKQKEQLLNASDDQTPDSPLQRDKILDGLIVRP